MGLFAAKPTIVFLSALVGSSACNAEFRFADHGDSAGISADDADAGGSDTGGRCKSDPDCSLPNLHCFEGVCVPCLQDSHCVAPLARCDLAAHRCVECGLGTDCLPTESCEPLSRTCVRRCGTGNPCPVEFGRCDVARGFCISCTKSAECSAAGEKRVCNVSDGRCVQCTADPQCATARPLCDTTRGACVKCVRSSDCPPDKPICDPVKGECN